MTFLKYGFRRALFLAVGGMLLSAMPAKADTGGVIFGNLMAYYGGYNLCMWAEAKSGSSVTSWECPSGATYWSILTDGPTESMQIALGASGPSEDKFCLGADDGSLVVYACEGEHKSKTLWASTLAGRDKPTLLKLVEKTGWCAFALSKSGKQGSVVRCPEASDWLLGVYDPETGAGKKD